MRTPRLHSAKQHSKKMAQNDRITEIVSPKAQEQVIQLDANLRKILATYNELAKASQKIVSVKQGNDVLKKRIDLDRDAIKTSTELAKQRKAEADAEAARQRAIKAGLTTETAKERAQRKSIATGNTNLQQIRSLNSFYQQQSRLLNKLRDDYKSLEAKKQLGIKLTQRETAQYARLNAQVRALDSALKRTDAAAGQFQRNVGNYAKGTRLLVGSLRSLAGAFGFTSGIYLFAAALSNSFKRVREFDKSMQNLAGVLRTTRGEISDIENEIIRVAGASVKTSREVATLAESLATLGLRDQDLINLIKPANDLSIALGATSDEAAEFLVQNLNAFGESTSEALEYADTIATIRTSTSLDFQRMRDSFQYLAPISRILGEDLAYTGGIIGLLSDNGLKAENAARLLGTAQQKLAKEGLSLTDALNQINEAQAEGAEGLELLSIASNLFGKQAAKVAVILATNQDEIQEYAERIRSSSGALDDLVNEQLKSLDAQIKILDSTWERLILTIENGEGKYARFFKGVTQGITGYLEELTEVEEAQSRVFETTGAEGGGFGERFNRSLLFLTGGLVQINTEYDKLVEQQREFNRYFNELGPNTSLDFLKDEIETLNTVLRENNDLTDEQRKIYAAQRDRVESLFNANQKNRNELEAQAFEIVKLSGHFEEFGNKIEILTNEQLADFINQNKGLLKTIQDINEEFDNQEFESLNSLNKRLGELRERYNSIDTKGEEFQQIKKEVEELEAYIAKITGRGNKVVQNFAKGSIGYYENLISEERRYQTNQATTQEEVLESQRRIDEYAEKIKKLKGVLEELNKVEVSIFATGTTQQELEKRKREVDEIIQSLSGTRLSEEQTVEFGFDAIEAPDVDEVTRALEKIAEKYSDISNEARLSAEEQQQIFDQLFSTFSSYYGLDLTAFSNLIANKEASLQDYANFAKSISNLILQNQLTKYDNEIEENRKRLDFIINDENATEEQKKQARAKADREEKRIRLEKAKAERNNILIQIAIDTAAAIAKTIALLGMPAAIPFIAAAAGIGAAQAIFVAAQPLPQFFKGKGIEDNYEGWATVNELPGQREVKIDKYGGVTAYKAGMQMDYVKKDDIIVPSMSMFNREIKDPGSDVYKRLSNRINEETAERSQIIALNQPIDTTGIERAVERAMLKYSKRPVNAKVKVEYPDNYSRY